MQSFKHVKVPSLSSLYTLDRRLPTLTSDDYNRIPRLRRHKWTPAEKQVLYLLNSHYANPPGELWRVFNVYFKEWRPRWVGPRKRAWETMRLFMMNPVRYCPWWTGAEARRVRGEIERVAVGVGVRLLGKGPLTPVRGRGKRSGAGSVSSVADGLHSVRSVSPDHGGTVRRKLFDAESAKRVKQATVTTNGLLTPPPTVKKKRNGKWKSNSGMDIPVPSIAFRGMQAVLPFEKTQRICKTNLTPSKKAFNHQSQGLNGTEGFVAGTFVNVHSSPFSIPETPPAEDIYIQELWRHLEKQHSGPTPFISLSPFLMRVVMHAFRRDCENGQRTEWSVAVIALGKVRRADVRAVWGLSAAGWNARKAFGEWVGKFFFFLQSYAVRGENFFFFGGHLGLIFWGGQSTATSPPPTSSASCPSPIS